MQTRERIKIKITKPAEREDDSKWDVVMHNDDVTDAIYVVLVLNKIFGYIQSKAMQIMQFIHENGQAVVATYDSEEEAEKKVNAVEVLNTFHDQQLFVEKIEVKGKE